MQDMKASELGTGASLAYGVGPPRDVACFTCGAQERTNKKWKPFTKKQVVVGWTCPACPRQGEPIRRITTNKGARFRAVVDASKRSPTCHKRKQVTATFDSLAEAREFVRRTRESVEAGTYLEPSRTTFRQVVDDWLRSKRDVRPVTLKGYQGVLAAVLDAYGDRPVQSLTRRDIEALIEKLAVSGGRQRRPQSHRTIVYTLGAIRQVFGYAVANGLISTNPSAGVKPPRKKWKDHRDTAAWDPADLICFRAHADRDVWGAAWRLTLSGLRRSEVLGLSWSNVNFEEGWVRIDAGRVALDSRRTSTDDPKSAASRRTVPVEAMHPGTMAMLRCLKDAQSEARIGLGLSESEWDRRSEGLVLVDALGVPVRPDTYSDRFVAICRIASVPTIRLHNVRHSVALMIHRANVAPADAAALLGHTLAVHLSTYVPRTESGVQTAASALASTLAACAVAD